MKPKIPLLLLCFFLFYLFDHFSEIFRAVAHEPTFAVLVGKFSSVFFDGSFFVFALESVLTYLLFYQLYPLRGAVVTILVYVLFAIPIIIGLRFLIEEVIIFQFTGHHNYNMKNLTAKFYFLDNIYFTVYFNVVAILFFVVQYERFSKMRKQALELQARNAELSFLKSQINPHFLFNNLNSIYTLVYHQSENALPAISKLSELLRYMLYQKEDVVLLTKEIAYLHNFIDLQLMRYDFIPQIKINMQEGFDEAITIIPLSLIPFVENAFKHGDLKDAAHPMSIDMEINNCWLYFKVKNRKNKANKDLTGGIGLENVKKRLELLKPNHFELSIKETDEVFDIELKLMVHE